MKYIKVGLILSGASTLVGWAIAMYDRQNPLIIVIAISSIIISTVSMIAYTFYQIAHRR